MTIKLTKEEFELLASGDFLPHEVLRKVKDAPFDGRHYAVDLSEDDVEVDEVDLINEACSEELMRSGFDADYEPTERGRLLEGLIDKFFALRE